MMGGKGSGKRSDQAKADDSIPFSFLLGEKYSGYQQAINTSKDLKVCTCPGDYLLPTTSRSWREFSDHPRTTYIPPF